MKTFLAALAIMASSTIHYVSAQTVGKKPPKFSLKDYNPGKDDGTLTFEVDVRMADCISYIELKNDATKKPVQVNVSENDYYLSEENGQDIFLRLPIGTLKALLKKKESLPTSLVIYSKSGKPIYTNELSINKFDLINTAENTWK
jgi:hypothetical protein